MTEKSQFLTLFSPLYKHSGHYLCFESTPLTTKDPKFQPCVGYQLSFGGVGLARMDVLTASSGLLQILSLNLQF